MNRRLVLVALLVLVGGSARGAEGAHAAVEGRYSMKVETERESPPIDDRILVMNEEAVTVDECVRVYRWCWPKWVRVTHTVREKRYNLINRSEYAARFGNDPTAQIVSTPVAQPAPPDDPVDMLELTGKQLARRYACIAALRNYVDSLQGDERTAHQYRIIARFNLLAGMASPENLGYYVYADEVVSERMDMGNYVIEVEAQINRAAVEELVRDATEAGAEEVREGSLALLVAGREVGAMRVRAPGTAGQTIENRQITEVVAVDPVSGKALNTVNTDDAFTETGETQYFEKEYKFRPADISAANSLLINQLTDADLEVISNADILDVISEMSAAGDLAADQTEQSAIRQLSTAYAMQDSPDEWMTPLHRAMAELECTYYGFALLEVRQEVVDPVTGNTHVEVELNMNVLRRDQRGGRRRVRYVNFVGTDSVINGTGTNHLNAMSDGIRKAAKMAGDIIADKIRQQTAIRLDREK